MSELYVATHGETFQRQVDQLTTRGREQAATMATHFAMNHLEEFSDSGIDPSYAAILTSSSIRATQAGAIAEEHTGITTRYASSGIWEAGYDERLLAADSLHVLADAILRKHAMEPTKFAKILMIGHPALTAPFSNGENDPTLFYPVQAISEAGMNFLPLAKLITHRI